MTADDPLALDGAAGGGQLLRTALALSLATGRAFEMEDVRGARETPGLRPQHLAAVRAAAEIGDATVAGAEAGAEHLTFRPETLNGGRIGVDIGTAGSVTLSFDALLPVALALDAPLSVTARGGTDVEWSPTLAYYRRIKLPLLRRWGLWAALDRDRTGFYPAGGGEATLRLAPASPGALDLTDRGRLDGVRIYSKASSDLAENADVASRQAAGAIERLEDAGLLESADAELSERAVAAVETDSPGSALAVALDYEATTAGFDALGEPGTSAEAVGREAADAALSFHGGSGAVDVHMGDQLVVFLALAGGRARIPEVTDHVRSGLELVAEFGLPVELEAGDPPVLVAERT